jgi:DNA-binding MarR family transcriptional regulator
VNRLHNRQDSSEPYAALERMFGLAFALTDSLDRDLAGQGLTRARAELIWRLRRGGSATQRELSDSLRCTPRNVTGLVDALEGAGLVARRPHPTDRRATLVTLTEEGIAVAAAWEAGYQELAAAVFGDLSAGDLRSLLTTIDRMVGTLRKAQSA